ncbi:MAG: IscS subfamily cysteine desulfurase [Alphaproteobacteria bacterium]|nr:MAG: IscS subfamily cysteine desulfurase [Alphaproteobacteria bacterium]
MIKLPIYLDYQATTPLDPRVLEVMMPYLTNKFGNPHSTNHSFGWEAEAGVEVARKQVADLIGAQADEIIFTSGATESNNIAIKGLAYAAFPARNHIITVATEHTCVLESCRSLERAGFKVTYLPVNGDGLIDINELNNAITSKTSLVSVMAVNNEIGVIQDLKKISQLCRDKDIIFHTDAAQAIGKIPFDMTALKIDLLSISGHKLYGPKGIGALYIRNNIAIRPLALFDGGGQERGLRSGTLAPALCAGLGAACRISGHDDEHISTLSEKLKSLIMGELDGVRLNGSETMRYPGNLNFLFEGVKGDLLVKELRNIALSTGSACSTEKTGPSHVLTALGLDKKQMECSLRIGFGRMTTIQEIDYAAEHIIHSINKIRRLQAVAKSF